MNSAYVGKLIELAEKDNNVIHMLADSGTGLDEMFRRYFPNQIYNFGIAEQNMISAAAGMATAGKIPFVFTAGAFLAYRGMEFIRDDICFQNLNVKLVGMGSGLSWSSLGPTHHTTEDVSVLRALPNLMILCPATPNQVGACVQKAYEHKGPVYIKIEMNHEKEFYDTDCSISDSGMDVSFGENSVLNANVTDNKNIVKCSFFVTGSILEEVMSAAEMLLAEGIDVKVINVTQLKPFSAETAIDIMLKSEYIFSIEEHNVYGGLGSILAETIAYNGLSKKVIPIGLEDVFATGYGTHSAVRKANNLDAQSIFDRVLKEIRDE